MFDKSALVSTSLGDYLSTEIKGLPPEEPVIYHEPFVLNGGLRRDSAESLERSIQIWDSLGSRRGQSANALFVIVFNSFFSLAFAFVGGFVGRYFYLLRQKQEAGIAEQAR